MKTKLLVVLAALPLVCVAETWKGAALVDVACSAKVKDAPDAHTRDCALKCSKTGFGIVASDGTFLKFDEKGNTQAVAKLTASKKADHLRVTVDGKREGDTIEVHSIKMD